MFPNTSPAMKFGKTIFRSFFRDAEGNLQVSYAEAYCRLVRNGEMIASKLRWMT